MWHYMLGLVFSFVMMLFPFSDTVASKNATEPPPPTPLTTSDPEIPVDELELLLKPLTKKQLLIEALTDSGGNKTAAAQSLGMKPSTFRDKLVKHGLG